MSNLVLEQILIRLKYHCQST